MRRYLVLALLAMTALTGCGLGQPPPPTPLPFYRYTGESLVRALQAAGLQVENPQAAMMMMPDAPSNYVDRWTFEIPIVAPEGGQILIFNTPERLAEWTAYLNQQLARAETRRRLIYAYPHANVILWLSPNLTPAEAGAYRDALQALP